MDPAVKAELARVKDEAIPINSKWTKLKATMLKHGLAWVTTEAPSQILCHPSNRAGIMLNQHDVHHKGARILALGASIANIGESVAIEVSQDVAVRKKQLEANAQLVANSGGALAPCSSQERLLSCSSSHLVAFCRAVAHG
jgi:hypothetical protein